MSRRDDLLAQVEQNRTDGLPIAKYTLEVHITANSHEELERLVHELDMNWYAHHSRYQDRDNIDSTDGRTSVLLVHTNPSQTPEAYREELMAWSGERKAARAADRESSNSEEADRD